LGQGVGAGRTGLGGRTSAVLPAARCDGFELVEEEDTRLARRRALEEVAHLVKVGVGIGVRVRVRGRSRGVGVEGQG